MYHTHLSWCPCHSEIKTVFGGLASSHFLLMFEKPTINARTWLDVRCNFSLAPIQIQMGPHFIRQKRLTERLGPKKSKMAAVFVQERNATSILVMSVSSWCEGHRRKQELNETSFCKFKCKKFRKFSRKSLLSSRSTGLYSNQETPKSMFSWRAEIEERCHWKGLEY